VPVGEDLRQALGAILVAVEESAAEGTWSRLKLCRASTCQVAFHDTSKNQSRQWCSMQVCGNRQKTKAYRQRQHASA
jgi:predicted RNA-binding Zn ribbon-like protein